MTEKKQENKGQKMFFAENLKTLRLYHRLTQEDVANFIGVSKAYISMLETESIKNPCFKYGVDIATLLEVHPQDLLYKNFTGEI